MLARAVARVEEQRRRRRRPGEGPVVPDIGPQPPGDRLGLGQLDWTPRFPRIAAALPAIADRTILDGEIVARDARGASDFGALQQALPPAAVPAP
jgi:hypothetical protein